MLICRCPACAYSSDGRSFYPNYHSRRDTSNATFDPDQALAKVTFGSPALIYEGAPPPRGSVDLMSLLVHEVAGKRPGVILDVGCGPVVYKDCLESLGFGYVGVDIDGTEPTLLADAHCLPFRDMVFDAAFSVAVLEHVHNPFLAVGEVFRVLKPGCLFVGVAAFGEPFHQSFFHASPWGLASALASQGFILERLWSCRDTLAALADMGGYPRIIRWLLAATSAFARIPILSPRRWFRGANLSKESLTTAGSIGFVARKPLGLAKTKAQPYGSEGDG